MATTQANPQERIARELLTQRPTFLGVDGDGCPHYWDSYEYAVVVVQDGAGEKFELDETPCTTLADWCEHVRDQRGWDVGPRVGGSVVSDLATAMEVRC